MDLRTHYPYSLLRYGLVQTYPSLNQDIKTEVAIIGAGITGALMAYHLNKAGIACIVVDKRHVATGSTAASTSLIQYEIDTPLNRLIPMVGEKNAIRSYELCRQSIDDLKQICIKVGNKENFEENNSLQFASYKTHISRLKKELRSRRKIGFHVDLLNGADLKKQFHLKADAALLSYEAAQVDAYLLTHKIFQSIAGNGCQVYDHTSITSLRHEKKNIQLVSQDGYRIRAKYLVVAAGYESAKYLHKRFEDLRCTYAIVSEPLRDQEIWKDRSLIWGTSDPYLYMRMCDDNRIVIGGKDTRYFRIEKQLSLLPRKAKALQKSFGKLFPHLQPIKIDFQWAGAFTLTKDGLPYIGIANLPNTFFALGYGGNGISFSLIAARLISGVISGKTSSDLAIFSFNR